MTKRGAVDPQAQIPVVMLMGPTASGKSELALALAECLPVEIVSVDSAQVYRGMDIGTAKPDRAIRARVTHHLLDVCDPAEAYSAGRFRDDALISIAEVRSRGRIPLLVGGTMLYFRALTHGLSALPRADAAVRSAIVARAQRAGWPALHAELAQTDVDAAARIHPNDAQRIQRALEVLALTGEPPSRHHARAGGAALPGPVRRFALWPACRADLDEAIRHRFESMMARGFLDEVATLRARPDLSAALPSMRAVGYRQLWAYLDGRCDLQEACAAAIRATRQLAKRQLTWLRGESDIERLRGVSPEAATDLLRRVNSR